MRPLEGAYRFPLFLKPMFGINLTSVLSGAYIYTGLLKWINDACGGYPNIELNLSDRASTKTDAVDALIRVRCLHKVCSHSSLGSVCVSQIRIRSHHCPHPSSLKIRLLKVPISGLIQHVRTQTQSVIFPSTHLVKDKSAFCTNVCHISDKIITFLALWCHLRGGIQPHTPLLTLLCFHPRDIKQPHCMRWEGTHVQPISDHLYQTHNYILITYTFIVPGLVQVGAKQGCLVPKGYVIQATISRTLIMTSCSK